MPEINRLGQKKQSSTQPWPQPTKHLHTCLNQCLRWIDYSKGNSHDNNLTLIGIHTPSAMRGLVHSLPAEPSGYASGRGTSVTGRSRRGTSWRGISVRRTSGQGHPRDRHRRHCRHLATGRVAATAHRHPRGFWLPELLAELAPLGKFFAASQAPKYSARRGYELLEFVVIGEGPFSVAVRQALDVEAVGYGHASPGLTQVAQLADRQPWYQYRQPMYLPSLPGKSSEVLCHYPHPHPPPHPPSPPPSHLPHSHLPPLHPPNLDHPFPNPHRRPNQRCLVRPHQSPCA